MRKRETAWSHSDGDAPWNRSSRTPVEDIGKGKTLDDLTIEDFHRVAVAMRDNQEYEPEERIRGQFT
jgi:hypothetical protein